MSTKTYEQVTKSWVHEPERVAAAQAEKFRRLSRIGEVPTILGGLAVLFLGYRLGGATGRALGALGATLTLTTAGRVFNRYAISRLRLAPEREPIPS